MAGAHEDFLKLIKELSGTLDQLAGLGRRKVSCTRKGDLSELDECMRREQVITLSLKTLEKKRQALLQEMGLVDVPLPHLYEHYPPALRQEAKDAVEELQTQFTRYQSAAAAARSVMERALRDIESMMPENAPPLPSPDEPPPKMRTDLRA